MSDNGAHEATKTYTHIQDEGELIVTFMDDLRAHIAKLEVMNRELKRQHVTVSNDLAHAQERIGLLTAVVSAYEAVERGINDYDLLNQQVDQLRAARSALFEAGFPW